MNLPDAFRCKGKPFCTILLLLGATVVSGVFLYLLTLYGVTINPWSMLAAVQPARATSPMPLQFPEYDFASPPTTAVSVVRSQTVRFVFSGSEGEKVEFYKNGVLQAVMRAPLPSRYEWTISNPDNGRHTWTAKKFERGGGITTSRPIVFDVLVPADQALPVVPVLSLRYIPNEDGVVSFSTLPFEIFDGTEGKSVAVVQDQINENEALLYNALQRGAIYQGFKRPNGVPAIQYRIIEKKEIFSDLLVTTYPRGSSTANSCVGENCYDIDYVKMLNNVRVCDYVERLGVKQIWLWAPGSNIGSDEASASGPYTYSRATNGGRTIPLCGKTYVLFTFNYGRSVAEAMESYLHHLEHVFHAAGGGFFWENFVGGWDGRRWPAGTGTVSNPRRCGWSHTPPQGNAEYAAGWFSNVPAVTNCGDWHPDGSGELQEMTCHTYSSRTSCSSSDPFLDADTGWKVYWLQNLPGKNNGIFYQGRELKNWYDFVVDIDKAMHYDSEIQRGANLFLPGTPPTTHSVTITKTGTGQGTVNSNPTGVNCGGTCQSTFIDSATLSLTATPAPGSTFVGWQGGGECQGNSRTLLFPLRANITCIAQFDKTPPTTHSVTITKTGTGQGTVNSNPVGINCGDACQGNFKSGNTLSLTAIPSPGNTFAGWQGSGNCTGRYRTILLTVTATTTCTARFNQAVPTTHSVTITKTGTGQGTVNSNPVGINCGGTCQSTFTSGTTLSLTATPAINHVFVGWQGSGACTGTSRTIQIPITTNTTCTAQFNQIVPATYSLTVIKTGTGQGAVNSTFSALNCGGLCQSNFAQGTTLSLTATPARDSAFVGWQGSGACTGKSTTIRLTLTANTTCIARFDRTLTTPTTYPLTVTKTGTGQGTVNSNPTGVNCGGTCQSTFISGTTLSLTATPAINHVFVGWQGSGACTGTSRTILLPITAATSCTARFDQLIPTAPPSTRADLLVTTVGNGTFTIPSMYVCPLGACDGRYDKGMDVKITAFPGPGSKVERWGGACGATTGTVCYVTMSEDKSVAIYFTPIVTTPDPTPIPTYTCTNLPGNASPYSAPDNTGLTSNTSYTHSASDTATKCQFSCLSGYTWNENSKSCAANPVLTPGQLLQIVTPVAGTYQIGQFVEVRYLADPSLASRPLKLELLSFYSGNVLSTIVSSSCSGTPNNCIWGNQTSYQWKVGANYPYPGKYRLRLSCVNGVGSTVNCRDANGVVVPPAVSEPLQIQSTSAFAPASSGTAAAVNAPGQSLFESLAGWLGRWF